MWNAVILPIITSLTATGLGIFLVWLFDRKRRSDERANQMSHILNEVSDIRNKIAISLERSELESAKNEKFWGDIRGDLRELKEDFRKLKENIRGINVRVCEIGT